MKRNEIDKMIGIIKLEIDDIRSYFFKQSKDSLNFTRIKEKINSELQQKVDYLDTVIYTTTISSLEADAMETIKNWSDSDKNRFYDAELGKQLKQKIVSPRFRLYRSNSKRNLIYSILSILVVVVIISVYHDKLNSREIKFVVSVLLAESIASKWLFSRALNHLEMGRLIKYFEDYLSEIATNYNEKVSEIAEMYSLIFKEIEETVNKD